ncbi:allergen Tha p 1 [Bombyx mori]|uniref:Uncharacterized protein n=1 Tax=Bombyx mori TaxID=7091 RepID=A0A8R2GAM9_BOMMO|nr:allergen Tha p 1 [Bombyx mori]
MNNLLIAILALTLPFSIWCYDEKYDKIDVDKILSDDKLFTDYINCMLDKGPCEVEYSSEFKELLPEVIATSCAKCTPIQKTGLRKTVKALSVKRPDDFSQFRAKYDPKGEYEKQFAAFVVATD